MEAFQWESARDLMRELDIGEIVRAHWFESGVYQHEMPLVPDLPRVWRLADQGAYRVWAARVDGDLAGYIAWLVDYPLSHRETLVATTEHFYVLPEYRGPLSRRLFITSFDALRVLGVKIVAINGPPRLRKFFDRLGCGPTTEVWSKTL